eukprot:3779671-Pleurochrysis_carterae.AAC.1
MPSTNGPHNMRCEFPVEGMRTTFVVDDAVMDVLRKGKIPTQGWQPTWNLEEFPLKTVLFVSAVASSNYTREKDACVLSFVQVDAPRGITLKSDMTLMRLIMSAPVRPM